uniref:Uncharacterized protein n=2 Tax=unclassified bacterial viruses TaxID=12333 RepID=A0AB39C4W8_9VIRU
MFKRGQLLRHKISGNCYFVYSKNPTRIILLPEGHRIHGWVRRDTFEPIGNNYTAKDSKESAPVILGVLKEVAVYGQGFSGPGSAPGCCCRNRRKLITVV